MTNEPDNPVSWYDTFNMIRWDDQLEPGDMVTVSAAE
jgi:hypothetical protein